MAKKIFIVACEASGDMHGARLISEILKKDSSVEFCGLGGDKMRQTGMHIFHDLTKFSALGFSDVVKNYFKYLKIFKSAVQLIRDEKPDAVIVIDSPAFNLRLAKKIKNTFPVIYYISPQLWAWGKRRIHIVKKYVRQMLVILPFEKDFYEKENISAEFVGHPLLDSIPDLPSQETLKKNLGLQDGQKAIGLFSGSREKEVRRILPVMLKTAELLQKDFPNATFFVSRSHNVKNAAYDEILKTTSVKTMSTQTSFYELVRAMDFALVTSGTATLETALIGTPFFLLYKTGWSTYFLGKHLIKVVYLGLVNLLSKTRVVPEFIQNDARPETIAHEAKVFLQSQELQNKMRREFKEVREKLGEKGASLRAAEKVLEFL